MQIHPIKIRIAKIQHVLTVCINNTTLEKKTYFEPDYSESKASLVVTAKPPQRECSPAVCGACLTAAKGSPSSQTVTEHHRLLDPSMNMTGCSIHR
jgi:hypothetical protein